MNKDILGRVEKENYMEIGMGNSRPVECASLDSGFRVPSVEERLLRRKQDLESQLNDVNSALSALQANPEILKVLCLISKVNY